MGTRKSREIKEGLIKKGFLPEQRDHTYLFLHVEGRKSSVRTKVSHGSKEYGSNLLSMVARQLHLTSAQLDDLLDCPMSYDDYLDMLQKKRVLIK